MKTSRSAVKSVENAFTALDFIVEMTLEKEGATLAEVAEKLGMQKTTARNLLQTMELCGYVTRRGIGFYRLGDQFRRLLLVSETANRLRTLSVPVLQKFCRKHTLPAYLSIFFNGKRHTSLVMSCDGVPQDVAMPDVPENAYRRASTRLLLAYSSAEEKQRFLAEFGMPSPEVWHEGAADLDGALHKIREAGYAINDRNNITHIVGLAVGIFDPGNRLCASLSSAVPESCFSGEKRDELLQELKKTALELTGLFSRERILL